MENWNFRLIFHIRKVQNICANVAIFALECPVPMDETDSSDNSDVRRHTLPIEVEPRQIGPIRANHKSLAFLRPDLLQTFRSELPQIVHEE